MAKRRRSKPGILSRVAGAIAAGARKAAAALSPAYRRRIERALEQGKTLQQARGHKPKEHVIRRERERREADSFGKLTSAERAYVRRFARQQTDRRDGRAADVGPMYAEMAAWAQRNGMDRFRAIVRQTNAAHRQYMGEVKSGTYQSRGPAGLAAVAAGYDEDYDFDEGEADEPPDYWFYYH